MNNYVKLGIGWKVHEEKDYLFLSNTIEEKLFYIEKSNQRIIKKILDGTTINELEKFGEDWKVLQKELEQTHAIFYSSNPNSINSNIDFGVKMASNSSFIIQPPRVSRLSIQINNYCSLKCTTCNKIVSFPCLSCSTKESKELIPFETINSALNFLSNFGLLELYLLGGDPLLDFNIVKKTVLLYKKLVPNGKISLLTNSTELLNFGEDNLRFLHNYIRIITVVTKENFAILPKIMDILKLYQIEFELQARDIKQNSLGTFQNNSIDFIKKSNGTVVNLENIARPLNLYIDTTKDTHNICYNNMIFLNTDGNVSVCKGYASTCEDIKNESWSSKISTISKRWKKTEKINLCENCGLKYICISCQYLKELQICEEISNSSKFCFTQKSDMDVI